MPLINKIKAIEINDSRGKPTLRVEIWADDMVGVFDVPSGASTGSNEAMELKDADGHVTKAIENINSIIAPVILGKDPTNQQNIDTTLLQLDGTPNKSNLGANSILGVSVACAKLAAQLLGIPTYEYLRKISNIKESNVMPLLFMNLLNGGKHAKNGLAFQEYHVVSDTQDIEESVNLGKQIQKNLDEICKRELGVEEITMGDEGGIAPKVTDVKLPLRWLRQAVEATGTSVPVRFALDVAASSFYLEGKYLINGELIDRGELLSIYREIINEFDILSIEDPFYEEDFDSFHKLKSEFPNLCVVGDDLTVTNIDRLKIAINKDSINGVIIKLNQIGTLTETIETIEFAVKNNIKLIISHRSGETMDDFIADLAYAFGVFGLKSGSPVARERMVKYERLIKISKVS